MDYGFVKSCTHARSAAEREVTGGIGVRPFVNDGGSFSGPLTGGGTIGASDTNGRGTATLSAGTATYDLIYYIVDIDHLIFNSAQIVSNGHPLLTGEAAASAGLFSQATLSNSPVYRFRGHVPGSLDSRRGCAPF